MRDVVLLVIDTQKGITNERLFEFERIRQNIMELIALARKSGVEVVFVQHDEHESGMCFQVTDMRQRTCRRQ